MAKAATAKAKMERYETIRTPKGVVGFSYLTEPDEKFKAVHRLQLFIDRNDLEVKAFVKQLTDTKAKYLGSIGKKDDGKVPALKKADEYLAKRFADRGVKEGDLYFEFTSNARKDESDAWIPIPIHDVKGAVTTTLKVFSGDVVRASVTMMGYNTGKEVGLKPYLNAVQVIEKRSSGGRANVFTDESSTVEASEPTNPFAEEGSESQNSSTTSSAVEKSASEPSAPADGGVDLADLV